MSGASEQFAPVERRERAAPQSIFFVGDSITLGWGDAELGGWPVRLIARLLPRHSVTAYNLGVRGDASEQILARWQDEVMRRQRPSTASVVVFAYGANDAKIGPDGQPLASLDGVRRNTRRILTAAIADHRALFVGPAPVDEATLARSLNPTGAVAVPSNRRIAEISAALALETATVGVPYLDLMTRLSDEETWFSALRDSDGIHPPARGYDRIAAHVGDWKPWASLFHAGDA